MAIFKPKPVPAINTFHCRAQGPTALLFYGTIKDHTLTPPKDSLPIWEFSNHFQLPEETPYRQFTNTRCFCPTLSVKQISMNRFKRQTAGHSPFQKPGKSPYHPNSPLPLRREHTLLLCLQVPKARRGLLAKSLFAARL